MTNDYCDYLDRQPLKGWGEETGFWRDRGEPPKVYYCKLTSDLCVADRMGMSRHSDHDMGSTYQRCPLRVLTVRVETD